MSQTRYSKLSSEDLQAKANILQENYKFCTLCPWDCRIDRTIGKLGVCRSASKAKISSAAPHHGEEPMISGTKGSGTIFFSNCNLRCTYCQNYQISQDGLGSELSDEQLADEMLSLQNKGCHNINLVSPVHFIPNFVSALIPAIEKGLNIPIVYNSNGYEKPEILQLLEGIVDIYLPDIKYSSNDIAVKLSNAPRYVEYNKAAIKEMHRQVGDLKIDDNGIAISGLLIRHLVLPNDMAGSQRSFKFLSNEVSKDVHIGIMAQYHPCYMAMDDANLSRRINADEYHRAVRWAQEAGLHNILTQELDSSEIFLPDFKRKDPFK